MPSDPFQMAMIHRTFRNEFGHISGLIRAVAPHDTKRSGVVGSYCDNMISVLHHHHAAEDEVEAVPLPLRLTLKLLGGRAYSAYRTRLYGDGD